MIPDDRYEAIGSCVHSLAQDPNDAATIYRQDHSGVYRTRDAADSWVRIESGLPARFGFPIAADADGGALYVVPLESDEHRFVPDGNFRVYRSTDRGDNWHALSGGLPTRNAYTSVLRGALAVDDRKPAGVYVGTTAGTLYTRADGGTTWSSPPITLPRIHCVEVFHDL